MTLLSPAWIQALTYSAQQDRLVALAATRPGVVDVNDLLVSQRAAGTNMSVDIAAGVCVIAGTDIANQGNYVCRSTAVENRTINAAPGAGTSRIDVVYAQVRDAAASGGAFNDWIIAVQTGTAAASPVPPAIPASALQLAYVTVASGVASITAAVIGDRRAEVLRRTSIDAGSFASVTPAASLVQYLRIDTRTHAYPVEVSAHFLGKVLPNSGQTNMIATVRLDISLDAGVSWVQGTEQPAVGTNNLLPAQLIGMSHRSGTATGAVAVRVMLKQAGGAGTVQDARLNIITAPRNS